jgi:MinD-like ATPase involved in chromosome partitioning or flagellar assembly
MHDERGPTEIWKMNIDFSGIIIIVGNYGSGKTEIAINLAAHEKYNGKDVKLADLDLVNPYFRTREAREQLQTIGIEVILPPAQYMAADLPILSPRVAALIRQHGHLAILDVGGDDVGATVLAALAESLKDRDVKMLQVINPFRPYTETVDGCIKICREIETVSKMKMDGIIGNANMIDDTQPQHIYDGYNFVRDVSRESGLPLEFITIGENLRPEIDFEKLACPVLTIKRQLVPPWRLAESLKGVDR